MTPSWRQSFAGYEIIAINDGSTDRSADIMRNFIDAVPNIIYINQPNQGVAARLPVVATRVTGIAELIEDNVNGYLVEPKDEAELAAALQRMVFDPEQSKRMGELNRKRIETDFALETEVKKLIHEFETRV